MKDPDELTEILRKHKRVLKPPDPLIIPKYGLRPHKIKLSDPPELTKLLNDLRKNKVPVVNIHKELKKGTTWKP